MTILPWDKHTNLIAEVPGTKPYLVVELLHSVCRYEDLEP
jgi:hypothetical protein